MGRAGAAALFEPALQRLARAVQANCGVVGTYRELLGDVRQARFFELDAPEDGRVLGFDGRDEGVDAAAHGALELRIVGQLIDVALALLRVARSFAVPIDDAVAEQAIEPGHRAFVVAQRIDLFDRLDERALEHVFRLFPVAQARLQKRQKLAMVTDEPSDYVVRTAQQGVVGFHLSEGTTRSRERYWMAISSDVNSTN